MTFTIIRYCEAIAAHRVACTLGPDGTVTEIIRWRWHDMSIHEYDEGALFREGGEILSVFCYAEPNATDGLNDRKITGNNAT